MCDLGNCELKTYNLDTKIDKIGNLIVYKLESIETNLRKIRKSRKIKNSVLQKQCVNDLGNCEVRNYNPDSKLANLFVYKLVSNETNHGKIHKSRKI